MGGRHQHHARRMMPSTKIIRVADDPVYRTDLYKGTSAYYDRYRLPYPDQLLDDLRARVPITGRGRLLDLACGTGQIVFALAPDFAEVWGVDQEAESISFASEKGAPLGRSQRALDRGNRRGRVARGAVRAHRHRQRVPPTAPASGGRAIPFATECGGLPGAALGRLAVVRRRSLAANDGRDPRALDAHGGRG